MSLVEVKVPDIGDFKEVEVIELLVKPGDTIAAEQSLITVESDKASMEIPSNAGGTVKELKVKVGDKVSEGSLVLLLDAAASAAAPAAAPAASAAPAAPPPPAAAATPAAATGAAQAAGPSGGGADQEIEVPDIGDFKDVEVIEILVKVGDQVGAEQSLITVESDKASMEIPTPVAGTLKALKVKIGDKVSRGSPLATIASSGGASSAPAASASAPAPAKAAASAPAPSAEPSTAPRNFEPPVPRDAGDNSAIVKAHASPSVRMFARELGVDLSRVTGSGPKQRILRTDVQAYVKAALANPSAAGRAAASGSGGGLDLLPWPKVDFAKFGPIESKPLSRIKKISAANLHRNWVMIPHVTNNEEADVTELEAFRVRLNQENAKAGVKVTMLAFLIKACVAALKKYPEFNASLDGDQLVYKNYWHIGFAADTPNGLVVPVIRDADQKGVFELARESSALAAKARDGKLSPGEMQGGTFSISSLGGIGGTSFTPIINAPEVAILGVSRTATRPHWDEQSRSFVPRLTLPLSLSYDHRVIDGAAAARFNAYLAQLLGDFRRAML